MQALAERAMLTSGDTQSVRHIVEISTVDVMIVRHMIANVNCPTQKDTSFETRCPPLLSIRQIFSVKCGVGLGTDLVLADAGEDRQPRHRHKV